MNVKPKTLLGVVLLILAVLVIWRGLRFVDVPPVPHHEGTMIYPAYAIKHGARPLTDVVIQHPPTTAYLYAAAMTLGGERLLTTRWTTLAGITLLAVLLAACISPVAHPVFAALIALLWVATTQLIESVRLPWSTHWGLSCLLMSLLLAGRWCDSGHKRNLAWAGFWAGLCLLFRVNLGIVALLALTSAVAWIAYWRGGNEGKPWFRSVRVFALIAAVTVCVGGGLIALHIGDWESIQRGIDFQKTVAQEGDFSLRKCLSLDRDGLVTTMTLVLLALLASSFRHPKKAVAGAAGLAFLAVGMQVALQRSRWMDIDPYKTIPGLLLVAIAYLVVRRQECHSPTYQRILLATAAGLATWTINYPMPGIPQAMWASSCALIAASQVAFRKPLATGPARALTLAAIVLIALLSIPTRGWKYLSLTPAPNPRMAEGFYRGIQAQPVWAEDYLETRKRILEVTAPGDPILIWRMESLHYCDLQRAPATLPFIHFDRFLSRMKAGPRLEQEILGKLKTNPPKAILLDTHRVNDTWPSWFRNTHGEIAIWIARNYAAKWESPHQQYCLLTPRPANLSPAEEGFWKTSLDFDNGEMLRLLYGAVDQMIRQSIGEPVPTPIHTVEPSDDWLVTRPVTRLERLAVEPTVVKLRRLPEAKQREVATAIRAYLNAVERLTGQSGQLPDENRKDKEALTQVLQALSIPAKP